MAEHAWTILCERAQVDPTTNNLSLTNVIDDVSIQTPTPDQPIALAVGWYLVTLWRRSDRLVPEAFTQRVFARRPGGATSAPQEMPVSLEGPQLRARMLINIQAINILGAGTYEFVVQHRAVGGEWITDASVPVNILIQETAAAEV